MPADFHDDSSGLPPAPSSAVVELSPGVFVPRDQLRIAAARGGGPGGQNVNKLNTKIDVWVPIESLRGLSPAACARLRQFAGRRRLTQADELHLSASEERSQEANRRAALERLASLIQQAKVEPPPRRKTRPTRASNERRLTAKRHRAGTKQNRREDD